MFERSTRGNWPEIHRDHRPILILQEEMEGSITIPKGSGGAKRKPRSLRAKQRELSHLIRIKYFASSRKIERCNNTLAPYTIADVGPQ